MARWLSFFRSKAALVGLLLALAAPAWAGYPHHPIRLIVPFAAGGQTDVLARAVAQPLSQALGQPVIVELRPGADGMLAGELVAKSPPDGYTLLVGGATGLIFAPLSRRQPPYGAAAFSPVAHLYEGGNYLYVGSDVPARTLPELLSLARVQPGGLSYGTATAYSELASLQFAQATKASMVQIPYKGEAPLLQDLLAGRIHLTIASGGLMPYAREGRLRVLATTLPSRSPQAPEVPTFAEAGVPPPSVGAWIGLFGPAGMPREVVERLARELRTVLARSDLREQLDRQGLQTRPMTPAEFGAFFEEQVGSWRQAMDAAGMRAR